ncbi:hypothetical protein [Proteiniclasticum sediminis]|uniref:hypothetical protein n=1 Tax=Proteiniclasticum sediminis TaxID=2804028 RepID=UPI001BAE2BE0|nr:hypothetical protein [Proteiniclasticum sediminis]
MKEFYQIDLFPLKIGNGSEIERKTEDSPGKSPSKAENSRDAKVSIPGRKKFRNALSEIILAG